MHIQCVPALNGRSLTEKAVTHAGMSASLLWYRSPEHTFLLPPSTAHRPGSAPARDTAPGDNITPHISQGLVQFPYVFKIKNI